MSRTTVRAQITAWLAPGGNPSVVEFCSDVIAHPPKVTAEDRFDLGSHGGSGGLIFVFIPQQSETRIALGGPHDGRKMRLYSVELLCIFRSVKTAEELGTDLDVFLDSLVERIQADRNLGTAPTADVTAGMIFKAGEGEYPGGTDIEVATMLPRTTRAGMTEATCSVKLAVLEVLAT